MDDNSEQFNEILLPILRRVSIVMLLWGSSIIGSIYLEGLIRLFSIIVFYVLSILTYFVVVEFDSAMEAVEEKVSNKTKGSFWFIGSIVTAFLIHYFFFWGRNAI